MYKIEKINTGNISNEYYFIKENNKIKNNNRLYRFSLY